MQDSKTTVLIRAELHLASRAGVMGMGGRYKDEGGMKGEEEVGRCERGGTCHNDKLGLRGGND